MKLQPMPYEIEDDVSGIINEDRLREFVASEVKKMKPETGIDFWRKLEVFAFFANTIVCLIAVVAVCARTTDRVMDVEMRTIRLDGRLTELSDFAHGIAGGNIAASPALADDAPAVPIHPRAIPESELPPPKEGQP